MSKCRGSDEMGSDHTGERAPEPCDWYEIEGYGARWPTEAEAREAAIEIARSHVRDGHAPGRYRVVKYVSLSRGALVNDGIPLRTKMWSGPHAYDDIDAGVRFAVRVLHSRGVDTCQSCQGGVGHAYPVPTVDLLAGPNDSAGFVALGYLHEWGLPVESVAKHWSVQDGLPYEMIWRIEFARPFPERADDELMFLWGYQAQELSSDRGRDD